MDQQVSPAIVVIVLILIVAILVGLYFLVAGRKAQATEEPAMGAAAGELAPPPDAGVGVEPPSDPAADQEQADQGSAPPANAEAEPAAEGEPAAGSAEPAPPPADGGG